MIVSIIEIFPSTIVVKSFLLPLQSFKKLLFTYFRLVYHKKTCTRSLNFLHAFKFLSRYSLEVESARECERVRVRDPASREGARQRSQCSIQSRLCFCIDSLYFEKMQLGLKSCFVLGLSKIVLMRIKKSKEA